jgi:NodT family efflux transporter outer membrane factor (OMF) lipoprotein
MRRALVVTAMLAGGCVPSHPRPTIRVVAPPPTFAGASAGPSAASIDWATFFADPQLTALITEVLAHNYDLQIALQRVELARAGALQARGQRLPRIALAASAGISKVGRYTAEGAGNVGTEIASGRDVPTHIPDLFVGLDASWEPDLWGRLRHLDGAAKARFLASAAGVQLVRANLVAETAHEYIELVALDEVQRILAEAVTRQQQALEVMRAEKQAGRTTELSVQQFEAQLADVAALQATTRERTRVLEASLSLLAGDLPRPIARSTAMLYREVGSGLAVGVPAELLRNRPDVRAAELEAAKLDTSAARAAFYPHIAITANIGYEAFDPRYVVRTPASLVYNVVAGIVAPLVNRRAIEADFMAANASEVSAMCRYQQLVLRSVVEVATALAQMAERATVVAARRRKNTALAGSVQAADALFRAGKATYLDVLVAQQKTLDAELELIDALRDQHVAAIGLYKALGGGWRDAITTRARAGAARRATPAVRGRSRR